MLKNLTILLSKTIPIYFLCLGAQNLKANEIFQQEEHCLAYKTKEKILLFVESDVIGKTCEISARLETERENTRYVVSFPIQSLDSGIDMRDEDIMRILSVDSHPIIRFVSDFVSTDQVLEALIQGRTKLSGMLEVGGYSYKVIFPLEIFEQSGRLVVTGKLVTTLTEFGLELPAILWGVIAETHDYLELLIHIQLDLVHGLAELQAQSKSQ